MDSVIIKTVGCPLDHDLLKSWEHFNLGSSHDSDCSETTDEEIKIKQDEWIEQFSFENVSDSKYTFSECSGKITEINSLKKSNSESFLTKDKANEDISFKNKDLLNIVKDTDAKCAFSEHLKKNGAAKFQDKDDTKEVIFVNDAEDIEKLFSSLSLKNNELLNNCENGSDTSTGYESDSDEQDESVVLRERYPQRHNRPENNKQSRISPFPQNHAKFCKQHFISENSQKSVNNNYMFDNINIFHDSCDFLNNISSTDVEEYYASSSNRTFHSCFPNSEPVIGNIIPCIETDEINDVIPCEVTNQVINGIMPCSFTNEMFDSVVPSTNKVGNNIFTAEINDIPNCNNLKETFFSESNDTNYIASDEERKTVLDSHFENLSSKEMDQMLKEFILNNSNQSCENLSEDFQLPQLTSNEVENIFNNPWQLKKNATSFNENNFSKNNQRNFDTEIELAHSFFLKENLKAISMHSHLAERSNVLEKLSKFHNNKSGNYSNLISENVSSINHECLSQEISDFAEVSKEIDNEILKCIESDRIVEEQKHLSFLSHPVIDPNWDMFPFVEIDDNLISECVNPSPNISQCKISSKKNDSKKKHIQQTKKSFFKIEQPKICCMIRTVARDKLFQSPSFCIKKWHLEIEEIRQQIKNGLLEKKKIIHYLNKNRKTKYRGTNLHHAIRSENIEKVFCIVEYHKMFHETISEINLRDSDNKTVLDYSKEKGFLLLTDYLKENNGIESVNV